MIAGVVLACGACAAPQQPGAGGRPLVAPRAAGAVAYEVIGSDVTVKVYRDGPLARLGHNHLIASTALSGRIDLAEPLSTSTLDLTLPLDGLRVDDPARRAVAGDDFSDPLTEADREGTRRNMLGPSLLDGANFPVVHLTSIGVEQHGGVVQVTTRVEVAGHARDIVVPATMELRDGMLFAHGTFRVSHADLGLTPFSVGLGALRVGDDMEIAFSIAARRART